MSARKEHLMINTTLFTQIGLDSGALTQLGSVVHQVPEPGEYRGVVLLDDEQVADFAFRGGEGRPTAARRRPRGTRRAG